jgi:hypothetical protein
MKFHMQRPYFSLFIALTISLWAHSAHAYGPQWRPLSPSNIIVPLPPVAAHAVPARRFRPVHAPVAQVRSPWPTDAQPRSLSMPAHGVRGFRPVGPRPVPGAYGGPYRGAAPVVYRTVPGFRPGLAWPGPRAIAMPWPPAVGYPRPEPVVAGVPMGASGGWYGQQVHLAPARMPNRVAATARLPAIAWPTARLATRGPVAATRAQRIGSRSESARPGYNPAARFQPRRLESQRLSARWHRIAGWPAPGQPAADRAATGQAGGGVETADAWRAPRPLFRPANSVQGDKIAQNHAPARADPPGWATTMTNDARDGCRWCGGS